MELHELQPREQDGRDAFGRYKAQTRAAAIAALSILAGREIDRVYCDLHDDFVIRKSIEQKKSYIFNQVKTKAKTNYNWTIYDLFGLNTRLTDPSKQSKANIKNSFVGKLLLHTIQFKDACESVVFLTNLDLEDSVLAVINDIRTQAFSNKYSKILLSVFNGCYQDHLNGKPLNESEIKKLLTKLFFETDIQHLKLKNHNFGIIARDKIYLYSEVDLNRIELDEILIKLLSLVGEKSAGVIEEINEESIEKLAAISINDLLGILSISADAYRCLLEGGDHNAIKSISIIQRVLTKAGADHGVIEFCSKCKIDWDIWIRNNRHVISEFELRSIIQHIRSIFNGNVVIENSLSISALLLKIKIILKTLADESLIYDLTPELILGGFFSELVKGR